MAAGDLARPSRVKKLLELIAGLESIFDRDPHDDDEDDAIGFEPDALHAFELGRAIPERRELLEALFAAGPIRNLAALLAIGSDEDEAGCALARSIGLAVLRHGAKQRPTHELLTELLVYLPLFEAAGDGARRDTIRAHLESAAEHDDSEVLGDDFDPDFEDHPAPAVLRQVLRLSGATELPLAVWALQRSISALDTWLDMHDEAAVIARMVEVRVLGREVEPLPATAPRAREIEGLGDVLPASSRAPAFFDVHPERIAPEGGRGAVLEVASELRGHGVRFDHEDLPDAADLTSDQEEDEAAP